MIRRNPRPLEIYFPPLNYYAEWHYFKTQHVSCSTACQYISARVIYPVRSGVGCIMSEQTRKSMFMIFFFLKSMFKVFSFSIFLFFCKSIFKKWFVIKTRLENRWEFENENPLPLSGNAKIKILFCHNLLIKKTNYFSFSWKIQTIVNLSHVESIPFNLSFAHNPLTPSTITHHINWLQRFLFYHLE